MRIVYKMVLMNGSTRARNAASLINQTNTQGGVKKQGLPSTVGLVASVSGVYRKKVGCPCPNFIISTTTSCGRPVGGILRTRC
jgi:hypothetical protein